MNEEETKERVQLQFGKNAKNYVTSKLHAKGKDLSKLLQIADVCETDHVLDIATGGGHTANAFAPLCKQVTALDLTNEILTVARNFIEGNGYINTDFVQGDAEKLPFPDETFDLITCRIAAHHFPHVHDFIHESYRTLKKGGTFYLIDNVAPENNELDKFYNHIEKERDYSHHRAFKKSEWIQMVEECGFILEEFYCFSKTFIFDEWCKNMNVSSEKKEALSSLLLYSDQAKRTKFKVTERNQKLYSFTGEAILLKVRKPM